MFDEHLSEKIPIDSVIITNRIRKDFGDINSLAESISTVGLLQPIVINENNEYWIVSSRTQQTEIERGFQFLRREGLLLGLR